MFGYIDTNNVAGNGVVKNVKLVEINIKGNNNVRGIAGVSTMVHAVRAF
jgi:hypothetical protein